MRFRAALVPLAVLLAGTSASAQGQLWIVSRSGCPDVDFTDVQSAVDAAGDGDTVLVRPYEGSAPYASFAIDGKALTLVTSAPGPGEDLRFGDIAIRNLAAGQDVVLRGFDGHGLEITDNLAAVWIEECSFLPASATACGGASSATVEIRDCASVVMARVTIEAAGGAPPSLCAGAPDGSGSAGLLVVRSTAHLFDCDVSGGAGAPGLLDLYPGGDGGPAVGLEESGLFSAGGTLRGGGGGPGLALPGGSCVDAGDGGAAIRIADTSSAAAVRGSSLMGGGAGSAAPCATGTPGGPSGGPGAAELVVLPGAARSFAYELRTPVLEETGFDLLMGGAPGDIVITAFSPVQTHHFAAVVAGTVAIGPSSFKLAGVLPASGELASPVVVGGGTVLPGEALTIHAQAFFFDGLQFLASAPAALVVVDRTTGPSDGCPSTTIHVDDDAPNDPAPGDSTTGDPLADGTLARPFDDLTEALAAVVPGTTTTILVEDGLYTGPGNTGVVLPLIALEIRSRNGAEKCVFTPDSGFVLSLTSDSVVSGLTFTGATAGAVTGLGGTLEECVVTFNSSPSNGGGLNGLGIGAIGCTISNNDAIGNGGGAWNAFLVDCTVTGNTAGQHGGGAFGGNVAKSLVSGNTAAGDGGGTCQASVNACEILGNTAGSEGGGVWVAEGGSVRSSIVRGNSAPAGAGIWSEGSAQFPGSLTLVDLCTVTENLGAGVAAAGGLSIGSSIVWNNTGAELHLTGLQDSKLVDYTLVQGGEAGVVVGEGLVWGVGNLDTDPLFADSANADFHLLPGSPCIEAGDPNLVVSPTSTDVDGDPRLFGVRPDMGADEVLLRLYVDDDAPGDPSPGDPLVGDPLEDGTEARPFDSIQAAIDAATPAVERIVVEDGVYSGLGNENLVSPIQELTLVSRNGAASTTIAVTGGSAFVLPTFAQQTTIRGFTLTGATTSAVRGNGPWELEECVLVGNHSGNFGGGVNGGGLLRNCLIAGNTADNRGGGTRGAVLEECLLFGNSAVNNGGGAFGSSLTDCLVVGNSAGQHGGGVAEPLGMDRCIVEGNVAGGGGGGVFGRFATEVSNSLVRGNTAAYGGGIWCRSTASASLRNLTVSGNLGGGLLVSEGGFAASLDLTHTILWDNPGGPELSVTDHPLLQVDVTWCDVEGDLPGIVDPDGTVAWGPSNIAVDPLFVAGDWHLSSASPCIDAGDPRAVLPDGATDLDGEQRVQGTAVDIGADEAQ